MKQYPFPDKKIWRLLVGLFLFGLLLLARDTLITTVVLGFYKSQFLMLGLIALGALAFLIVNRKRLKEIFTDPRIVLLLVSTAVILLPMVLKRDWQMMYFSVLLCVWVGIFLSYFVSLDRAARYYVVILCGLGLYSVLATYFLRLLPDRGLLAVPVLTNSVDVEFYNFGLCFPGITYVKNRNFGIFREPGVYQFFVLLALFANNELARWEKPWQMWAANGILALTMLSTFATGGVIEMGLLAVILFIDKKWYRSRSIRNAAIALAAVLGLGVVLIVVQKGSMYVELMGMVTKFTENPESTGGRLGAIFTDAALFFRHPLAGGNLGEVLHAVEDNTTSTMLMFAVFGILGGLLHTAGWVALVWDRQRKVWANLALLVVMFMSFNTQNLIADVFFWLLPMMALAQKGLPLCRKRGDHHGT